NVTARSAVVDKRKVWAVQTVVQPAVPPSTDVLFQHRPAAWFQVQPGLTRVVVTDAKHRQRSVAVLIVVIGVVSREPGRVAHRDTGHRRLRNRPHAVVAETADRTALRFERGDDDMLGSRLALAVLVIRADFLVVRVRSRRTRG